MTEREKLWFIVKVDGRRVVTWFRGVSIPNLGSGVGMVVESVPSGSVVVVTLFAPNASELARPFGNVLVRLSCPVLDSSVWYVLVRPRAVVTFT